VKSLRHILVATDFSAASRMALRRAMEMALANKAELWIVHVASPPWPMSPDGYVLPRIYDEVELAVRADAQKRLGAILARARKSGIRGRALLLRGVAHEAIVKAARAHRADMIVLGTHGRTGVARFFVGSVAARVVAAASCPVLTVRGR
jgi:nucleotide-binding universal stress UspA family protein